MFNSRGGEQELYRYFPKNSKKKSSKKKLFIEKKKLKSRYFRAIF